MKKITLLLCIALGLTLISCKIKKAVDEQEQALHLDSLTHLVGIQTERLATRLDSVYVVRERFDTLGRLLEREQVSSIGRGCVEQRATIHDSTHFARKDSISKQGHKRNEHSPQSLGTMLVLWWVLVIGAIVVGIFVSVRYLRIKL